MLDFEPTGHRGRMANKATKPSPFQKTETEIIASRQQPLP